MPENQVIPNPQITPNTQITFTLKGYILTILSILGIFFGFYEVIIIPQIEDQKTELAEYKKKADEDNKAIQNQLIEINNGIGNLNGNVEGINNRFRDLNQLRSNTSNNTSGGFNN